MPYLHSHGLIISNLDKGTVTSTTIVLFKINKNYYSGCEE